jgi:hypothetical protein
MLVPALQELGDYALRTSEVIASLENVENRPQTAILKDIQRSFADVARVRRIAVGSDGDDIDLSAGVALLEHSRGMVLASACTAATPKSFYPNRKPEPAEQYIRRVRLGQTEAGSYVLAIISPVYVNASIVAGARSDPFERRAMKALMEGSAIAVNAAVESEKNQTVAPLLEAMERAKISSNLCDALAGLTGETGAAQVDIVIRWAPGSGLDVPTVPSYVSVPQKAVPALREASRIIKERFAYDDYTLEGYITDLHGDLQLQHDIIKPFGGLVAIAAPLEGKQKKVTVRLGAQDYEKAGRAHMEGTLIKVLGDLRKEGRTYVLTNPHSVHFEFVEDGEPSDGMSE